MCYNKKKDRNIQAAKREVIPMEFDAFTGGVADGGLRTKNDIKILICYMLATLDAPFSKNDVIRVLQETALANYFEINDAFSSLLEMGNLETSDGQYFRLTESGRQISGNLYAMLPLSVRDKAIQAANQLRAQAKIEKENTVEIERVETGYQVTCHVSGGSLELMNFTVYVPDLYRMQLKTEMAEQLKNRNRTARLKDLGGRIVAAAGIGNPARCFASLRACGLSFSEMPLPDHFDFSSNPFRQVGADIILITEKDAVKCSQIDELIQDERLWVVPAMVAIDNDELEQKIVEKCRGYKTA